MVKKALALALAMGFLSLNLLATDAVAKRRCPKGFDDDVTKNVCVPKR
jgi:hypothetical protein